MVKKKLLKIFSILSFLSMALIIIGQFYVLEKEVGFDKVLNKYVNQESQVTIGDFQTEKDLEYLRDVVVSYYSMDSTVSFEEKKSILKSFFSKNVTSKIFSQYSQMVSFFIKNGGKQLADIEKIILSTDKDNFDVYLYVIQEIPKKPISKHLIYLKLRLDRNNGREILSWNEKILNIPPETLSQKGIALKKGATSSIKLPCKILSVAAVRNKNQVDANLDSISNQIQFHSKDALIEKSIFRANCRRRYFDLIISDSKPEITVFQRLAFADGVGRKKLSPAEKRNISIRNQLKSWGLESK